MKTEPKKQSKLLDILAAHVERAAIERSSHSDNSGPIPLNNKALGKIYGVSHGTIQRIRTKEVLPTLGTIEIMANTFGTSVAELLTDRNIESEIPTTLAELFPNEKLLILFYRGMGEIRRHELDSTANRMYAEAHPNERSAANPHGGKLPPPNDLPPGVKSASDFLMPPKKDGKQKA